MCCLQNLLSIDDLSRSAIDRLFLRAEDFLGDQPLDAWRRVLAGRVVANMFFEDSTRTRTSFEIAAKKLGADVVNIDVAHSSLNKGETLLDTAQNLQAMGVDGLVLRHPENGAPQALAKGVSMAIINAGDGMNEHPTQALLDALTIKRHRGRIEGQVVAICGDIAHSRVARSNAILLTTLGARLRLIAPPGLMPDDAVKPGVQLFDDLADGIKDADVIMMLRLQKERMEKTALPNAANYFKHYGLDHEKIRHAKPGAIVMHPGPTNRGVEISAALADDPQYSVILDQVRIGVAMRMAVLEMTLKHS